MPINPINFTAPKYNLELIKPDYSGFANFLPNAIKAYNQPIQLAQEREGRESENREKKINAYLKEKYGEPKAEAEIGLTHAQIGSQKAAAAQHYASAAHSRALAGNVGKIAPTELSKIINERNHIANDIEKNKDDLNPFELQQKQEALSTYDSYLKGKTTTSSNNRLTQWKSLPNEERNFMIAKAREGWGANADQVLAEYLEGKSLEDMAAARGIDLSKIGGSFAPTKANITQIKNQEGNASELEYLEEVTTEPLAKYSRKFGGYSFSQIADALSGENEDDQARFLAARALQPEITSGRLNLANGSNAFASQHDAMEKALGNSKIFESLVSPKVYKETQRYINEWLKEGFKRRKNAIYGKSQESNPFKKGTFRGKINGRTGTFPLEKKAEFIKKNGVVIDE